MIRRRIPSLQTGTFSRQTSHYSIENAALGGSASDVYCGLCSGASKAGNIGGSGNGTVTSTNVNVPTAVTYQVEVDYLTSGMRSFFVSVNGGTNFNLSLNGSSFDSPASTVIPIQLQAGNLPSSLDPT